MYTWLLQSTEVAADVDRASFHTIWTCLTRLLIPGVVTGRLFQLLLSTSCVSNQEAIVIATRSTASAAWMLQVAGPVRARTGVAYCPRLVEQQEEVVLLRARKTACRCSSSHKIPRWQIAAVDTDTSVKKIAIFEVEWLTSYRLNNSKWLVKRIAKAVSKVNLFESNNICRY